MDTTNKIDKYLNENKKSQQDVAHYIESEGLGYAIQNGIDYKSIDDQKLAKLWKQAGDIMNKIEIYLRPLMGN